MKLSTFSAFKQKALFFFRPLVLALLVTTFNLCSSAQAPAMSKLSVQLLLNLNGGSHNTADGLVAVFAPSFSAEIGNEDSYKFTNLDENIAINRNGTDLSIEGRPTIVANDTLPLKIWKFRQKTYCLKISGSNFKTGLKAFVKDAYLKKDVAIDLAASTIVPFEITNDPASFEANRFCVVFKTQMPVNAVKLSIAKAFVGTRGIRVDINNPEPNDVKRWEIERSTDGVKFENIASFPVPGNTGGKNFQAFDTGAVAGNNFYRAKGIENSGLIIYSEVQKLVMPNEKCSFTVYPNPIKGNNIGLNLINLVSGQYIVRLYKNSGQKVYESFINHNGFSNSLTLQVPKKIEAGMYRLQLQKDNLILTKTVLFQ